MKKQTAPIKYFGGKGSMYNNIIKYFPTNDEYDIYVEPFGGSYSIGLNITPPPKIEIYNDLEKMYILYIKCCLIRNYLLNLKINVI